MWQNYRILSAKKFNRISYFFQRRPLSKNNTLSFAYFVQKTSILSKTGCSPVICSNFFYENLSIFIPKFGQKTSILSKLHCLWANKVNRMPGFLIFNEKINAFIHIFCQKNVNSLKNTLLSCPYFVKKGVFSQKHNAHFFHFF